MKAVCLAALYFSALFGEIPAFAINFCSEALAINSPGPSARFLSEVRRNRRLKRYEYDNLHVLAELENEFSDLVSRMISAGDRNFLEEYLLDTAPKESKAYVLNIYFESDELRAVLGEEFLSPARLVFRPLDRPAGLYSSENDANRNIMVTFRFEGMRVGRAIQFIPGVKVIYDGIEFQTDMYIFRKQERKKSS